MCPHLPVPPKAGDSPELKIRDCPEAKLRGNQDLIIWCPHRESNLELALRRHLLYPFNYEDLMLYFIIFLLRKDEVSINPLPRVMPAQKLSLPGRVIIL